MALACFLLNSVRDFGASDAGFQSDSPTTTPITAAWEID